MRVTPPIDRLRGTAHRNALSLLLLATLILAVAPAAAARTPEAQNPTATKPTVTVVVELGFCAFNGTADLVTTDTMRVKLRRSNGTLAKERSIKVSENSWKWGCPGPRVRAGDRIEFFRKGASKPFRVYRLPQVRVRADRVKDVVRGVIPGEVSRVDLWVSECNPSGSFCPVEIIPVDPAAGTGAFQEAVAGLTGRSQVTLDIVSGLDRVYWSASADQLTVEPGSAVVTGRGSKVGAKVTVTVKRGTRIGTGTGTVTEGGFSVKIRRNGSLMAIKPGDTVTADLAKDATLTVPISFLGFTETTVYGQCFTGAEATVIVDDGSNLTAFAETTTSADDGSWSVSMAAESGDRVDVWCANAQGDRLHLDAEVG